MSPPEWEVLRQRKQRLLVCCLCFVTTAWLAALAGSFSRTASGAEKAIVSTGSKQSVSSEAETDASQGAGRSVLEVPWWTMDAGGGVSTGDSATLAGTAGQFDTGQMTGGGLTLHGGFWPAPPNAIFADGFESGDTSAWGP
ncbi:MAG: hypothetical protein QNL26_10850 [Acidimicrobiia bacterium]|nr:hypothetical protein [Acidimicrobiia bacterium]